MSPHRFPAEGRRLLTDEHRRQVQPAEEILKRMAPAPNEICIDLGSGPGYLTLPLSSKVRCVIALDAQKEMLDALLTHAKESGGRIVPVIGEMPWIPARSSSVDRAILINVAHEVEDKAELAREIKRVLKKGGRLSIVDFPKKETSFGPPVSERLSEEEMTILFSNLHLIKRWSFPEFYQLEFSKD